MRRVTYPSDERIDAIIKAIVDYNKTLGFHGMSEAQAITVALNEYATNHQIMPKVKGSTRRGRGRPAKPKTDGT